MARSGAWRADPSPNGSSRCCWGARGRRRWRVVRRRRRRSRHRGGEASQPRCSDWCARAASRTSSSAAVPKLDPVGDLEGRALDGVVDRVDDLPCEALALSSLFSSSARAMAWPVFRPRPCSPQGPSPSSCRRPILWSCPSIVIPTDSPRPDLGHSFVFSDSTAAFACGKCSAVALAEGGQFGLMLRRRRLALHPRRTPLLHVQLRGDDVAEPLHRWRPSAVAMITALRKRLADLHLRTGAGGAASSTARVGRRPRPRARVPERVGGSREVGEGPSRALRRTAAGPRPGRRTSRRR